MLDLTNHLRRRRIQSWANSTREQAPQTPPLKPSSPRENPSLLAPGTSQSSFDLGLLSYLLQPPEQEQSGHSFSLVLSRGAERRGFLPRIPHCTGPPSLDCLRNRKKGSAFLPRPPNGGILSKQKHRPPTIPCCIRRKQICLSGIWRMCSLCCEQTGKTSSSLIPPILRLVLASCPVQHCGPGPVPWGWGLWLAGSLPHSSLPFLNKLNLICLPGHVRCVL